MKHHLSALLAATLVAGLTACDGTAQTAPPSPTQSSVSRTVPDVTGAKFQEARGRDLSDFKVTIVGSDGKRWKTYYPDKTVVILSTDPAAGTVTDKAGLEVRLNVTEEEMRKRDEEARAVAQEKIDAANTALKEKNKADEAAAKLAKRYEFTCGGSWQPSGTAMASYHSLKEVWASKYYSNTDTCSVKIDGAYAYSKPALLPAEQSIVDILAANGGDASGAPAETFDRVLRLCAKPDSDYADKVWAKQEWKKAHAKAALALCPEAPHAAMLQEVVSTVKVSDGTKTVGKDMEPGTYRTKPSIKDCYWSRTTGGGNIIANDFVGFAPDGVTVTVYIGEGFESQRCGTWTKTG